MTYPLDIDGTPIHKGDRVTIFGGNFPYTVERVTGHSIFVHWISDNKLDELDTKLTRPKVVSAQPTRDSSADRICI